MIKIIDTTISLQLLILSSLNCYFENRYQKIYIWLYHMIYIYHGGVTLLKTVTDNVIYEVYTKKLPINSMNLFVFVLW